MKSWFLNNASVLGVYNQPQTAGGKFEKKKAIKKITDIKRFYCLIV